MKTEIDVVLDWTVLEDTGVEAVTRSVASKIEREFGEYTTCEDQWQEAALALAANAPKVRAFMHDPNQGAAYLHRWLWSRLYDAMRVERNRAGRNVSLTRLEEQ